MIFYQFRIPESKGTGSRIRIHTTLHQRFTSGTMDEQKSDGWVGTAQDIELLEQALARVKEVMTHLNEEKRRTEGQIHIFDIYSEIENCPASVVSSHRRYSELSSAEVFGSTWNFPVQSGTFRWCFDRDSVLAFLPTNGHKLFTYRLNGIKNVVGNFIFEK